MMDPENPEQQSKASEPFLKWPGGKRWLAARLAVTLRAELQGTYYEPFLGAGAVFLHVRPKKAVLSDTNEELIAFFRIIRQYPEQVVASVWRLSNSAECYEQVRASAPTSDVGRAARFLYLNRTCWGGIYRVNQSGCFNVPFGNSGRRIISRRCVEDVSKVLKGAKLQAGDFAEFMDCALPGDVVYADPPYTTKGQDNGFVRYNEKLFSWRDQERLATSARKARARGVFVCVSGLYHPEVVALYRGWWVVEVKRSSTVSRGVTGRREVSEALFFSRRPKELVASFEGVLLRAGER